MISESVDSTYWCKKRWAPKVEIPVAVERGG